MRMLSEKSSSRKKLSILIFIFISSLIIVPSFYFSFNKNKALSTLQKNYKRNFKETLSPENLNKKILVTKILDGDTIIVEGGFTIRLLGIDADEKGYPCYQEAKKRLEQLILNKEVELEKDTEDKDQYGRYLRYIILNGKNINIQLVKEGLAISRFSSNNKKYKDEIISAEKYAIENKIGCKWSKKKENYNRTQIQKTELKFTRLTQSLGFKIIDACKAKNYYGQKLIVEGEIVDTYRSKTNTVFLNFKKPYPNQCFSAVLFSSYQYKFVQNPEFYYLNKTVRIFGEIKNYKGKPQIILKSPTQIEIGK